RARQARTNRAYAIVRRAVPVWRVDAISAPVNGNIINARNHSSVNVCMLPPRHTPNGAERHNQMQSATIHLPALDASAENILPPVSAAKHAIREQISGR